MNRMRASGPARGRAHSRSSIANTGSLLEPRWVSSIGEAFQAEISAWLYWIQYSQAEISGPGPWVHTPDLCLPILNTGPGPWVHTPDLCLAILDPGSRPLIRSSIRWDLGPGPWVQTPGPGAGDPISGSGPGQAQSLCWGFWAKIPLFWGIWGPGPGSQDPI